MYSMSPYWSMVVGYICGTAYIYQVNGTYIAVDYLVYQAHIYLSIADPQAVILHCYNLHYKCALKTNLKYVKKVFLAFKTENYDFICI